MILTTAKFYATAAVAAALAVALAGTGYLLVTEKLAHGALRTQVAEDGAARTTAALGAETATASKEFSHTVKSQENSDAFTVSQPLRDAIARADDARHKRVLIDQERRSATYRAMAASCAATNSDSANRLIALDQQLTAGIGVVGKLRSDLVKRDAEVVLVHGQMMADRALIEAGSK